ncbi:MAG: PRD domain-containing protein [Lachnospiraceae bacterium]|nr:PRD domain-containing protein [Lachnospiraceae bacterium]
MLISKILNNNLVLSRDEKGREVIVKGCGIAFQKKRGAAIDESKIEKIFVPKNKNNSRQMQEYLLSIPEEYLDFVQNQVEEIKEKYDLKLNDSICLSLSDHLMGSVKRFREGIRLTNVLLVDIRQLYRTEYQIGVHLLEEVNKKFHTSLPLDEAGFLALHFVNAQEGSREDGYEISLIVKEVLDIVKQYYQIEKFDEDSLYYQRFLTHLKFFAQRYLHKEFQYTEDAELFNIVKEQCREAYGCVKMIYLAMEEKYSYALTEEEMLYLMIHIQKITEKKSEL